MTGWKEDTEGWKSAENTDWYKDKQAEDKKIEAEREEIKKEVGRIFSDMFGQEVKILG